MRVWLNTGAVGRVCEEVEISSEAEGLEGRMSQPIA